MSNPTESHQWRIRRREIAVLLIIVSIGVCMALPALDRTRHAAADTRQKNNFKQIGLAIQNYSDAYLGKYPAHARYTKDGQNPLSSWRVTIVPYLESDDFYRRYHLEEPWDSPHNLAMTTDGFGCYRHTIQASDDVRTHCQLFIGDDAVWHKSPAGPNANEDSRPQKATTILVIEASEPVTWTKPADLDYSTNQPIQPLGFCRRAPILAVMGDGSVKKIERSTPEATIRGWIAGKPANTQ